MQAANPVKGCLGHFRKTTGRKPGIPGKTVARVAAKAVDDGSRYPIVLSASETPRRFSGVSKLLKPYECQIGMTQVQRRAR